MAPMTAKFLSKPGKFKKYSLVLIFLAISASGFSQKAIADSLSKLLSVEKADSNQVRLMWRTTIAGDVRPS